VNKVGSKFFVFANFENKSQAVLPTYLSENNHEI